MLVSNNSLLNILLPNENKVLKDVLKEADAKTLNNIKSGTTVGDILKNLFNDLKSGDKNKATIENLLKNSNVFKDLGSFSKAANSLLNQINSNENLSKYKPLLQSFLKDISAMDEKSLKESISKSGVFLEARALEQLKGNSTLPKNLENILNQIKTVLKDIPTLDTKKIDTLIDKILQNNSSTQSSNLQNNSDLKSLVSMLQNLSKNIGDKQVANLTTLTNSLKNISNEAQLIESKINNTAQNLPQAKEAIISKTQETLVQLKAQINTNSSLPNAQTLVKQIDTLLQQGDLFNKNSMNIEPKNLLTQLGNLNELKNASLQNSNILNLLTSLKNLSENITTIENKVLSNQNIQAEKSQLTQDIKQTLNSLKNELINIRAVDTKVVNQIIDKLLNLQNLFTKVELPVDLKGFQQNILNQTTNLNIFQSNFSSNINNLIINLKENITNLTTNQNSSNLQNSIIKIVEKLEAIVNNFISNPSTINEKALLQNPLQNDMKTILLQMQEELISKSDAKSLDSLKQVDKLLMQIEYHQLLSSVSNSNNVYIPFMWDILDDGSISMKKIDEEKFYCEINLSLKEFGQTQLLLSLYDKNKLDLTIYASKDSFKQSIRENSIKLKQALNSVDLIPVNIKIIDLKKEEEKPKEGQQIDAFYQNTNLGFGVDIKA